MNSPPVPELGFNHPNQGLIASAEEAMIIKESPLQQDILKEKQLYSTKLRSNDEIDQPVANSDL